MEEPAGDRGLDTRNSWVVSKKRTIKWSIPREGTTWCEKCNVKEMFFQESTSIKVLPQKDDSVDPPYWGIFLFLQKIWEKTRKCPKYFFDQHTACEAPILCSKYTADTSKTF